MLSLPRRLRFLAARDKRVASRLLELFTRVLFAWQRRSARRMGVSEPRTAGVTVVQRFGGAINLNVHFHTLVPDGVFELTEEGPARFVQLATPDDEEVERILRAVIRKVDRKIDAARDDDGEEDPRGSTHTDSAMTASAGAVRGRLAELAWRWHVHAESDSGAAGRAVTPWPRGRAGARQVHARTKGRMGRCPERGMRGLREEPCWAPRWRSAQWGV